MSASIKKMQSKRSTGILPTLYHDLNNNSTDTLSKYNLTMQQINIQEPDFKLNRKYLKIFV